MSNPRHAVVLGSTGGVGAQNVEAFAHDPTIRVIALAAAGSNLDLLAFQAVELNVYGVALCVGEFNDIDHALTRANEQGGSNVRPEILIGPNSPIQAASAGVDIVVNAIAGVSGIGPTLAGLESGAQLWLANTESSLCPELLTEASGKHGDLNERIRLLNPALNGIQQTLREHEITKITLTTPTRLAHGGRRRRGQARRISELSGFGAGIAGLELRAITDVEVEVIGHDGPVASVVELRDGRCIFNFHNGPTQAFPPVGAWEFHTVSQPGLDLALMAGREGKTYPLVLHQTQQQVAEAHLDGLLGLEAIPTVVAQVLDAHTPPPELTPETLEQTSAWAREHTDKLLKHVDH